MCLATGPPSRISQSHSGPEMSLERPVVDLTSSCCGWMGGSTPMKLRSSTEEGNAASGPGCPMEVALALISKGRTRCPEGKMQKVRSQNESEPGKGLGLEQRLDQDVTLVMTWFSAGRHPETWCLQLGQHGHLEISPAIQPILSFPSLHSPYRACLGHVPRGRQGCCC